MKKTITALAAAAAMAAIAPPAALAQGELPVADVGVGSFDAPDPVTVGDEITYTINAVNNGPFDAPGTKVQDRLDPSVRLVSATPSQGGCQLAVRLLTCNLGVLTNGERARIIVVVRTTAVEPVTNRVSISADVVDLNPRNDEDSDFTRVAPQCGGMDATMVGTGASEKITGSSGRDVIVALGGNDTVNGRGGNDVICGGGGKDALRGKRGNDLLFGEGNRDTLAGGAGDDDLNGGAESDRCRGGRGRNTLQSCER